MNVLHLIERDGDGAIPLWPVGRKAIDDWLAAQPPERAAWLSSLSFRAGAGETAPVPDPAGGLAGHVVGLGDDADGWAFGDLPNPLPAGLSRIGFGADPTAPR